MRDLSGSKIENISLSLNKVLRLSLRLEIVFNPVILQALPFGEQSEFSSKIRNFTSRETEQQGLHKWIQYLISHFHKISSG